MEVQEIKSYVILDTFRNFAYFGGYLQTKTFACKQDCEISSKLQMV